MPFVIVGLDWARPKFLFQKDRIDQMVLRQRAQVRIGVRAAGNKTKRANKEEEAPQGKPSTSMNNLVK
jgi:hypothetical protein